MLSDKTISPEIEDRLRKILQETIEISSSKILSFKQDIIVARLNLKNNRLNLSSLIIKYIDPLWRSNPKSKVLFLQEYLNYKFLSELEDSFSLYPKLIGADEETLILEDLGTNTCGDISQESDWSSIARTLAMLHSALINQHPLYTKLKKSIQLFEVDTPRYSQEHYNLCFDLGVQNILEYCEIFNIETIKLEQHIKQVKYQINNPGELSSFIHSDLTGMRQLIYKQGKSYLLDFEHGKYSHIALDIAIMMVGKFELNVELDVWGLNFPDYPPNFANIYRQQLKELGVIKLDDRLWRKSFSAALIYCTFRTLGALLQKFRYLPEMSLLYSYTSNLNLLFSRLLILLEGNNSHRELKEVFQQLTTMIYF